MQHYCKIVLQDGALIRLQRVVEQVRPTERYALVRATGIGHGCGHHDACLNRVPALSDRVRSDLAGAFLVPVGELQKSQ